MNQNLQVKHYESGHLRALLVITFLALGAAVNLLSLIVNVALTGTLDNADDPNAVYEFDESLTEVLYVLVALLHILVFVITAVLFLMWLHRAYRNLPALGAQTLETTPGWAVGYFFIPFANLVKPFHVVREVWNKSDPQAESYEGFGSYSSGTPALVGWWWAFWIIANVATRIADRVAGDSETVGGMIIAARLGIAADLLFFVASVLAIMVVKKIDERQEAKSKLFVTHVPPSPPQSFESH
jgi:NADH:ubiquinone oxidoreductase subunit 2 (subunit N)